MAITNPADVIKHIIHKEVQHDSDEIAVDMASYNENIGENGINSDITLAFTVHDKQINSKKLIEGIASNSRLIPYIKDNTLILKGIMPSPSPELTAEGGDVEMYIDQSDIISYTNKRTAPEKVYSKVIVNYHYDYALKDFTENTLENSVGSDTANEYFDGDPHGSEQAYDIANLGLKAEQELLFDAHYIRDKDSAEVLQEFLLLWHCNQHNVLKLRLPLKYIQLKIGDYIGFDKLINGVKLFGEDYSISGWYTGNTFRNGQQILPVWMVTSTAKTLTHIDIEMIQMHNCSDTVIDTVNVPPEINSVDLVLIHPTTPENVIGNNIILNSTNDTYFKVRLIVNATDINLDELLYFFQRGENSLINSIEGLDSADFLLDLIFDNGIDNDADNYIFENNTTLELGLSPNDDGNNGEWLTDDWLTDSNVDSGSYIEFPSGVFIATVSDEEHSTSSNFPSFRIYKDEIPEEILTASINYNAGWNLIGLPLSVDNNNYLVQFPNAVPSSLYGFDGTYSPESNMEVGKGYMLNFNNSGTVEVEGTVASQYNIALMSGWNLIGGIGNTDINFFSTVIDPNEILVTGSLYEFDGTYLAATHLQPGRGYWVRASNSGIITIPVNNG